MSKRWYVLQVTTGKEIDVKNCLEQQGYKVLVPLLDKQIRFKGIWHRQVDVIFSGYIFVKLEYKWSDYYRICQHSSVIKILGGGKAPIPLSDEEIMAVKRIDMLRSASLVRFEDGKLIPLNGILYEFKDCLISYKRRQRRAVIEINIAKIKTKVTVSFIEQK
ncbi:MAG: transcription termination/antitermination NusG family protein [Acutalibacteraceae bacterium]